MCETHGHLLVGAWWVNQELMRNKEKIFSISGDGATIIAIANSCGLNTDKDKKSCEEPIKSTVNGAEVEVETCFCAGSLCNNKKAGASAIGQKAVVVALIAALATFIRNWQ